MSFNTKTGGWSFSLLGLLTAVRLFAQPTIQITNLPPFGSFQDLGGFVANANPVSHRVAVFIFVPGAGWWTKPTCGQPLTAIQANGSWVADITTGGSDQLATRIAALLVSTNYNEPCVLGSASLPTNVTAQAVASTMVDRDDPAIRRFDFSGYNWWVKSSTSPVGPGPNYFSDSTNNVWLDTQGRLHMRITNRSNQWQGAEVVSRRSFGYGHYRFQLDCRVDNLDPNVVLGLFTWSDDPAYAHREIDVECSRWSNAADVNNSQFVVQPWDTPGHLVRYAVLANATDSAQVFTWETNRIRFQAQLGDFSASPASSNVISSWDYTLAVPVPGEENVRLNLWLVSGNPPTHSTEVEVIIRSFQFVPPGPALAARLTHVFYAPAGQVRFDLVGQTDRFYEIQRSTNLLAWPVLTTLLATNGISSIADTNNLFTNRSYYRAVTLP